MRNLKLLSLTDLGQTKTGFTLLEVMIAISILSVALVALFGSQSRSLSLATEAHFNNIAPMLASYKLAELESQLIPLESNEGDFEDDFSGYTWEIEVSEAAVDSFLALDNIQSPLQQVLLTVSWTGTNYSYTLTHYAYQLQ